MKTYEKPLLTKEDYKYIYDTCKNEFGWDEVTITGGEPLVRKDIADIALELYQSNAKITMVTNGEFLDKHINMLKYINRINLSVHTLDEEKYSNIIRRKDKLKKVKRNICNISNIYPSINIRLNCVIIKGINDSEQEINEYIDFAKRINASIKFLELYSKTGIVTLEEIYAIISKRGFKYIDIENINKQELTDGETKIVLSKIFCASASKQHNPEEYCNKYNDIFITPAGKINICRENKEDINILEQVKTRDYNGLVEKVKFALNSMGKNCVLAKEEKKLAINGGTKVFGENDNPEFVSYKITKEVEKAVIEQLHDTISIYDNSNIFKKFETEFAAYHNKTYGLTFNSGTSAIWGMYEGIGLKPGDEIICPIYTFFATVTPVLLTGATPVFVDCDKYGNIDVNKIREKINKNTKAIVVTHMWGYPCEMDVLRKIADENKIFLLEDCSHAHGAMFKDKLVGEWGDAAAFSLQGQKIISGGEGGILITSNKDILNKALLLGHYNKRCKSQIEPDFKLQKYCVTGRGLKLRAHPLAIRLAYEKFKELKNINKQKNEYANKFIENLEGISGIEVLKPNMHCNNSWYSIIFKYKKDEMQGVTKERFLAALKSEGAIEFDIPNSTTLLKNLPLFQEPGEMFPEYVNKKFNIDEDFKNADDFSNNIIKLPLWEFKEDEEVMNKYIRAIKKVCYNKKELL